MPPDSARKPHVLVVGSANEDFIASVDRRPVVGETVTGARLRVQPGGKGANQAVAAAASTARATLVAALGDDTGGQRIFEALIERGVDTAHLVTVPGARTGAAFVTVTPDGENTIVVAPGANAELSQELVRSKNDVFRSAGVVLVQGEISPAATEEALRLATATDALRVVNLAPPFELVDSIWPAIDVLVVNAAEASTLVGFSVEPGESAAEAAQSLVQRGAGAAIITLGGAGVVYATPEHTLVERAVVARSVRDTSGAGDAFVGTLAGRLAQEATLTTAIRTAVQVAGRSVEFDGAMLPSDTRWCDQISTSLIENRQRSAPATPAKLQ